MTVIINSRADLTLEHYRRVSCQGEGIAIGPQARDTMTAARRSFAQLTRQREGTPGWDSGTPGRDSGTPGRGTGATDEDSGGPGGGGAGAGALPGRVVRGIIFARLADVIEGHTACRPSVARNLAAVLDGPVPSIFPGGLTGTDEAAALAAVIGAMPAGALDDAERRALAGGAPCSAALAADSAVQARHRLPVIMAVFALSAEAMSAPLGAYHPALTEMWGDPFTGEALGMLGYWLSGAGPERRPYQAPVSYRVLPVVLGQACRAVAGTEQAARISLSSVTADPVYLPPGGDHPSGVVLRSGGAHNLIVYPALDALSASWADLCTLADRHTAKFDRGEALPPDPRARPDDPGVPAAAGLGRAQVGIGEHARHAAARTFLPPSEAGTADGLDDIATPTFLAYEKNLAVTAGLDHALAALAAAASRALSIAGREPGGPLRSLLDLIRRPAPTGPARLAGPADGIEQLAQTLAAAALGGFGEVR
jgi:histidine ammonia-lyase